MGAPHRARFGPGCADRGPPPGEIISCVGTGSTKAPAGPRRRGRAGPVSPAAHWWPHSVGGEGTGASPLPSLAVEEPVHAVARDRAGLDDFLCHIGQSTPGRQQACRRLLHRKICNSSSQDHPAATSSILTSCPSSLGSVEGARACDRLVDCLERPQGVAGHLDWPAERLREHTGWLDECPGSSTGPGRPRFRTLYFLTFSKQLTSKPRFCEVGTGQRESYG